MPRDRWRATLDADASWTRKAHPTRCRQAGLQHQFYMTYGSGEAIAAVLKLRDYGGWLELSFGGGSRPSRWSQHQGTLVGCNGTSPVLRVDGGFECCTARWVPPRLLAAMLGPQGCLCLQFLDPVVEHGALRQR
jgi:hypothetical protein